MSDNRLMPQLRFPHVRSLDGVRGLAALAIVMHHCLGAGAPVFVWPLLVQAAHAITMYFFLGVDLFFILSGYLITSLLLLGRRSPNYYHNFYWKRVFRILPALLLALLVSHALGATPWVYVLLSLLFVANLEAMFGLKDNGPYWSLSIEEQFYLVWPLLIHKARPRTMVRILLPLMIFPPLLRVLTTTLHHGRTEYTFVHCDGLAWGAFLAILAFRARVPWHYLNAPALWRRFGRPALLAGLAALAFTIFLAENNPLKSGLLMTCACPLFAGTIAYFLTHPRSSGTRIIASRPLRFLGDVSYLLYLSHLYILMEYDRFFASWSGFTTQTGYFLRFFVVLALSLLWSAASLHLFERPVGKLRRYILKAG